MNSLLLDTAAFFWIIEKNSKLSHHANAAFLSEEVPCYLSHISLIEIAIKYRKGKLALSAAPSILIPEECAARAITLLPLDAQAIFRLEALPQHHADPFDRLIICQALVHDMTIITPDKVFRKYKVRTVW